MEEGKELIKYNTIVSQQKKKKSETLNQVMPNISETPMQMKSNSCIYSIYAHSVFVA